MNFHIMTLFPEMIMGALSSSITGRASDKGYISFNAVNIRDYSNDNKHHKVDDYTYGGGAGMLMQAQPIYDCYLALKNSIEEKTDRKPRVIYVTPQGSVFNQKMASDFAKEEDLIFLCGHYEGVDERVLEEIVTDYVSIGDYVLTGGELPAMVMIDAISRLVPGVLNNDESAMTESFNNNLLEYPQYSRPEIWHDKKVPEVLLNGNHSQIEYWRLEQSIDRTRRARPDLLARFCDKTLAIADIKKAGVCGIPASQALTFHDTDIMLRTSEIILIKDHDEEEYILCPLDKRVTAIDEDTGEKIADFIFGDPGNGSRCVVLGFDPFPEMASVRQTMITFTEKNPLSSARVRDYGDFGKELREKITKAHDQDRIFFEYLDEDDPHIEDALKIGLYKADVNIIFFIKMQ